MACTQDEQCKAHSPGATYAVFPEEIVPEQPGAPYMMLPAAGCRHAEPFSVEGGRYVAVANYFSGCEPNGYEQDSVTLNPTP